MQAGQSSCPKPGPPGAALNTDPFDAVLEIDARGHHCPVPTLKLQKAIRNLAPGAMVRLLADDPMAKVDVPHFCRENGHQLISAEAVSAGTAFTVAKRA